MDKTLCKSSSNLWNVEKLQAYFSIVKSKQPKLSEDASLILKEYYRIQRRNEGSSASRITVRLLESLVRLAQAHAKLMFRNEVTVQDAVVSVSLMEASHQTSSIDAFLSNPIQTTFPLDPEEEYIEQAHKVLGNLGLQRLLNIEVDRYMKGHRDDDPPGPEDTPRACAVLDNFAGTSQLEPEKSDLSKKLDAVFNNIRQNKLREEHKALAFQRTGQSKKRKKKNKGSDERKKSRKKDAIPSESDSSDNEVPSMKTQKSKIKSKNSKNTKQVFVASASDTDGSLENPCSPTNLDEKIREFSQPNPLKTNNTRNDDRPRNDRISNSSLDTSLSSDSNPRKAGSKIPMKPRSQISQKTFLNQSIFAAADSESNSDTESNAITSPLRPSKTNAQRSNENGGFLRPTVTNNQPKGDPNPSTSKFQVKTPVSTKTISKLKSFAFKETKKTDEILPHYNLEQRPTPMNTSSSSLEYNASSEELFISTEAKTASGNLKTKCASTQSSIFYVADDDNNSDYEL